MGSRPFLLHIQNALNEAHLSLTDGVTTRGDGWRDDELRLLDFIDLAIGQTVNLRCHDRNAEPIRIRYPSMGVGDD